MKRLLLLALLLLIPAALLGGCEQASPGGLPVVSMKIGTKTFHVEVAATEPAQETGLMKRDSMPADHGMIFVFPEERMLAFWMKNTRIPLDIIYLDAGGRVVSVRQMKPYDLTAVSSLAPAKYAIELNEGAAADAGVKIGDLLTIPDDAKKARK